MGASADDICRPPLTTDREERYHYFISLILDLAVCPFARYTSGVTQPESTTWTLHLAARQPGRAIVALVIIFLTLFAVAFFMQGWNLGGKILILALAVLLLLSSIAEFLFPVTYTLDAEGAHVRLPGSHRVLAWNRVRRVYLRLDGIKLSPLAARGWIESYRGVFLRTPSRDEVLEQVRAWLDAAGVTPEIEEDR